MGERDRLAPTEEISSTVSVGLSSNSLNARILLLLPQTNYQRVIASAALVFLASAIFHWPTFHVYSDITSSFWGRTNAAGIPFLTYEIPYVQYVFEYPPVCGLVVWLGGWLSRGSLETYAGIEFAILGLFFVATAHYLYKFLEKLNLDRNLQLLFTIFVPSAFAFAAYNFDIIETFFIVFSLYFFVAERKHSLSAAGLGLAIATKLFPVLLLPIFIQEIRGSLKGKLGFLALSLAVPLGLNLPFMIANYSNWLGGYVYLKNWGLEDTFLVWIFPSRGSYFTAEIISGVLVLASSLSVYLTLRKHSIIVRSFLVVGSFVLFSYIAPPQLNLDLLPFFALVPLIPLPLFYFFEAANGAFISLWDTYPEPALPGVVQAIALARQTLLAVILILLLFRENLLSRRKRIRTYPTKIG